MTHDAVNDPYARKYTAAQKRREFEKIKRTVAFKHWKQRQLRIQKSRCAYCRVDLKKGNIVTHIDHINPLYFEGSNDFSNLLLTCRRCNVKKWINNRVVKPDWVKTREKTVELQDARRKQKKQMKELVQRELDEQILWDLKQRF